MLVYPKVGQEVQIWYKKALADWFPLHGKIGVVRVVAKGKGPRNHGIMIDGKLWVVPCGNLRNPIDRTPLNATVSDCAQLPLFETA